MAALLAHPQAEVAAVCDAYKGRVERSLERIAALCAGRKPRVLRDYREAIGDKSMEGGEGPGFGAEPAALLGRRRGGASCGGLRAHGEPVGQDASAGGVGLRQ